MNLLKGIEVLRFADGDVRLAAYSFTGTAAPEDFTGGSLSLDVVDYLGESYSRADISASLLAGRGWTGLAAGDTYSGIGALYGALGDDLLIGDHADNYIWGVEGDNTLVGNGGDDTLVGEDGIDVAVFSYDRDRYFVGAYAENVIVHDLGAPDGSGDGLDTLIGIEMPALCRWRRHPVIAGRGGGPAAREPHRPAASCPARTTRGRRGQGQGGRDPARKPAIGAQVLRPGCG